MELQEELQQLPACVDLGSAACQSKVSERCLKAGSDGGVTRYELKLETFS